MIWPLHFLVDAVGTYWVQHGFCIIENSYVFYDDVDG